MSSTYDTKGSSSRFQLPFPKIDYGKKRFGYWGALIWNKLPEDMRECKSINLCKSKLTACFRASLTPYYNPSLEYFIINT